MLKQRPYLLLLSLLLLINHRAVQASGPEDYFGQEEADYDYYGDEDFDAYDDVNTPHSLNLMKDESSSDHLIFASAFIGGIDARGSHITIHDSESIDLNNLPGDSHYALPMPTVKEEIIDSPPAPVPLVPTDILHEMEILSSEMHDSLNDGNDDDDIADENHDAVDHAHVDVDAEADADDDVDDDVDDSGESEHSLPPVTIKQYGVKETFVDKMQGLQLNMDAMVTILKEIAGKVGCPLAKDPVTKGMLKNLSQCPAPFIQVNSGECLFVDLEKKLSWTAARFACNKLGSDLVYPLQQGQGLGYLMRLVAHVDIPNTPVWVGGSDRQHEGVWNWLNGKATPNNMAWCPGHPQNLNGREDCMAMSFVKPPGLKASNCHKRKHYVCQKKI